MKLPLVYLLTLTLGCAARFNQRRRRSEIYGDGLAPRSPRNRKIACCALLGLITARSLARRRRLKARTARRDFWTRAIFQDHESYGAWYTLIPTLRAVDHEGFYNFLRMTVAAFDHLLQQVNSLLSKKSWRKSVCPGERLAITLRYLATGDSMVSLSYLFRVSPQCISLILFETTTIIWAVLKETIFEPPTEENWLHRAAEFETLTHCVGAIDGKHVRVRAFPHCGAQ